MVNVIFLWAHGRDITEEQSMQIWSNSHKVTMTEVITMKHRRANTQFLETRSLRGEANASKKRAENLKRLKVEKKEKISDPPCLQRRW